jgi:hypothetical protein
MFHSSVSIDTTAWVVVRGRRGLADSCRPRFLYIREKFGSRLVYDHPPRLTPPRPH